MKLNLLERLALLQILPEEGNFVTLKVIRDLKSSVGITADEFKEFELIEKDGQLTWNAKGQEEKEFVLPDKARSICSEQLKKLSESNKLNKNHISLYEKFVEN